MKGPKPNLGTVIPMKGSSDPVVVPAPDHLSEGAVQVWNELAPKLASLGRLEPIYRYEFAGYCESVSNFIAATICLQEDGKYYTVKTRNGEQQKKTAAWSLQQESMNAMRQGAARFGLTPVDAVRLSSGGQGDLFDKMEEILNGTD